MGNSDYHHQADAVGNLAICQSLSPGMVKEVSVKDEVLSLSAASQAMSKLIISNAELQALSAVPRTMQEWRRGRDSNPRRTCILNGFRDRRIQPLCHLSIAGI